MRAIAAFIAGALLASAAVTAAPLPFLTGKATITRITEAISSDPANPTITVEVQAMPDGVITGGTCSVVTANSAAAKQFTVGSVVKLVLGGK